MISLFLTDKKVSRTLVCSSIRFFTMYLKKWIKKVILSFVQKTEIKCSNTFEMLTVAFGESSISRTQVQLRYNRFKEDAEQMSITMLVLVARARQQPMKTLKQ